MNGVNQVNRYSLMVAKILLMCLCLFALQGCESRKTIVNALDEREANEILVFLATKGIDASKVQSAAAGAGGGGPKVVLWDISVASNESVEAMALLNQAGLPRRRAQNLLNIFTGTGLVPSEMEQKIRYQSGLAEQIASTIRKIDGVLDAEVQISFPEEDPLNPTKTKQPITASVWVKHNGVLDDPNSHLTTKIKRLVAASVPALDFDNVTVVGEKARFSELEHYPLAEEEKQYVSIWSVIVAKESVPLFRTLFFSFVFLILLLTLLLLWLAWKLYPLLKTHGGLRELFHLKPIIPGPPPEPKPEVEAKEEGKEEKKEETSVDKDVDQT